VIENMPTTGNRLDSSPLIPWSATIWIWRKQPFYCMTR
jgi:hypothetical protein